LKSNPSDPLPPEFADALARVRLGRLGSSVLFFPAIGSTNDLAAAFAQRWSGTDDRDRLEGLVVVADAQTAGRGRHGRVWVSPAGSGLYVSVLLTPARARIEPLRATMLLTLAAGVGIAEGIEAATGLRAGLKWPNDLLVGRRKLAGILAEATSSLDAVVVGFGINVNPAAFPGELVDHVTSIESELGRAVDRSAVLAGTLAALAARYDDLLDGRFDAILDAWRRRAPASAGAKVTWNTPQGRMAGVTAGIDDHGALLVRVGARVQRVVAGEVTLRPDPDPEP
jgi:BirA family biotin operon repressor/biotin-[acetyl-CoA-carboxylase] ligase